MIELLLILVALLALVIIALQVAALRRASAARAEDAEPDPARDAAIADDLARRTADALDPRLERLGGSLREPLASLRTESADSARRLRDELQLQASNARRESADAFTAHRKELTESLDRLGTSLAARFESIRTLTQQKLDELRDANQKKLDEMRGVVEEKLQKTIEERVGAAFRSVGEQLTQVHAGLGEMRGLAGDVGDLKRVLTNVKTRGTWGEVQLEAILSDILTPDQYETNVEIRMGSNERVEFAVRYPGDDATPVLIAIDSKFPRDDYERLLDARQRADSEAETAMGLALERAIRKSARDVFEKYVHPPRTLPMAILFLPTEGLYAEISQRPGLTDELQRNCRVLVAGPSNLAALLTTLRLGFRALAIQKRSDEVWKILGKAKDEFGKFGDVLAEVQKHLERAQLKLEVTGTRTRQIGRALKGVEALPAGEEFGLLPGPDDRSGEAPAAESASPASQSRAHESRSTPDSG